MLDNTGLDLPIFLGMTGVLTCVMCRTSWCQPGAWPDLGNDVRYSWGCLGDAINIPGTPLRTVLGSV